MLYRVKKMSNDKRSQNVISSFYSKTHTSGNARLDTKTL